VSDADHVIRPIVRRGRAVDHDLGVDAGPAELTIIADGGLLEPIRADRARRPARHRPAAHPHHHAASGAAAALLQLVQARTPGADAQRNIR
jgi:hypothetical protein